MMLNSTEFAALIQALELKIDEHQRLNNGIPIDGPNDRMALYCHSLNDEAIQVCKNVIKKLETLRYDKEII